MALLNLPNELIIQILSHLTHNDLIACQLSNSALYTTIKTSVLLNYKIALSTYKATDNLSCPLSVSERLQALKDSEDAWTFLRRDFKRKIAIDFEPSGIYDLSDGVFLLGNASRTALHHIKLPSSIDEDVEWKKIQLNRGPIRGQGMIVDMGFCLHEHDLLAVVTTKPCYALHSHTTYDIKIVLFKLSTGEPHPAAKESTIDVFNSHWDLPGICIEVVGDRLVLILPYSNNHWMPDDLVFVYDWRNAVQTMSFAAPYGSYSGLVFLAENLILIPNARTNALEIWDILSTTTTTTTTNYHQPPRPACILQLPQLSPGNSLSLITCRGEPNPIGSGSQLGVSDNKPFHRSAHEAIMLFQIHVQLGAQQQQQHHDDDDDDDDIIRNSYSLFIHRKALYDIYERQCVEKNSKLESGDSAFGDVQAEGSGLVDDSEKDSESNDSGLEVEDTGFGDLFLSIVEDDYDADYDNDDDDDESEFPLGSETEDDMLIRATDNDPIPIPWSSWGPPITRWVPTDNTSATQWITTTAGQRAIICRSQPEIARQYIVLDFNPASLRRAEALLSSSSRDGGGDDDDDAIARIQCFRHGESTTIQPGRLFKEPVVGELPFVICASESIHAWDGAFIDEERVIGPVAVNDRISAIEVHHFGGEQK